ncbi:hypothetical protein LC612_37375 [Nostoc sp. CHAB 5834]|nr:hypothetical protein [Nostoc sp. CHAB 5834]
MKSAGLLALALVVPGISWAVGPIESQVAHAIVRTAHSVEAAFNRRMAAVNTIDGTQASASEVQLFPQWGFTPPTNAAMSWSVVSTNEETVQICIARTVQTFKEWSGAVLGFSQAGLKRTVLGCAGSVPSTQAPAEYPVTVYGAKSLNRYEVMVPTFVPQDFVFDGALEKKAQPGAVLWGGEPHEFGILNTEMVLEEGPPIVYRKLSIVGMHFTPGFSGEHNCVEVEPNESCMATVYYTGSKHDAVGHVRIEFSTGSYALVGLLAR